MFGVVTGGAVVVDPTVFGTARELFGAIVVAEGAPTWGVPRCDDPAAE